MYFRFLRIASCFHIIGQIQIHSRSLRVARWRRYYARGAKSAVVDSLVLNCIPIYIYSVVKYRLYGSVFCKRVYTGHYFLYFKNRFSCFFRCSYDKQRYLTYMLIVEWIPAEWIVNTCCSKKNMLSATASRKDVTVLLSVLLRQNADWFSKFLARNSRDKFLFKSPLKSPSEVKPVSTLPCEIFDIVSLTVANSTFFASPSMFSWVKRCLKTVDVNKINLWPFITSRTYVELRLTVSYIIKIVKHPAVNRDVSCKSSSRLPLLSSRPVVTFPDSGRYCRWPAPILLREYTVETHVCGRWCSTIPKV